MRRFGMMAAVAGLLALSAGPSRADLYKCQNKLQIEGINLQKQMYGAVQKCADTIRQEKVKGTVSTLGDTLCSGAAGCLAKAAAKCEGYLAKVYDVTSAKPGKSFVNKFRADIEKLRQPSGTGAKTCEDADLAVFTGLQHLTSGGAALSIAPPTSSAPVDLQPVPADGKADVNGGGKFMTDWLLFAIESQTIKQLQNQTPDLLSLFADAASATVDVPAPPAKGNTSCSPLDPGEEATNVYRPNLCRFGVECKSATCSIDTAGICTVNATPPATACDTSNPHGACNMADSCIPTKSQVTLQSPTLDNIIPLGPLPIPIFGAFTQEVCRPGPSTGTCYNGGSPGGAPCMEDTDCPGSTAPCNMFPGLGAGAAFQAESNTLYLVGGPAKGLNAPQPPIPISPFDTLVSAVCVDIVSAEGWCDCSPGGLGVKNDATVCQDHIAATGISGTQDGCGALKSDAKQDGFFPGTQNGPYHVSVTGGSTPGDCIDLVTLQFKIITSASDMGLDGLPCTDDDTVAPTASFTVPLTSGDATATIKDALIQKSCCNNNPSQACMQDADCTSPGLCNAGVCGGPPIVNDFSLGPVSGGHPMNACAKYRGGSLSGLKMVSAATILNLKLELTPGNPQPFDGALNFELSCK
ncbi:MAG: hypothetical protein HY270_06720 [Deltaproteobacteria bacterium]|nr:hypothetical protein [Deltaproteobacteria bacterium]